MNSVKDTNTELPTTGTDTETDIENETETEPVDLKETAYEMNITYLRQKGMQLSDELSANSIVTIDVFLSLLVEAYESLGEEIDISKSNPNTKSSDTIMKLTRLGVYDNYFAEDYEWLNTPLDYGTAGYWLMKLQDTIQERLYWRNNDTAIIDDLLRRINVSTALHTWTKDTDEVRNYTLADLIDEEAALDQQLTRLITAEMLVSAYEDTSGEIPIAQSPEFRDTDNIYAKKSNQFFFWPETDKFEPDKTGKWSDWSFMSAIIYDSQIRLGLNLEESKAPYGAVVATLTSLFRGYEDIDQSKVEEKIVLNERPYDWYVNQQETGEYSAVNCMPSTVVMAIRYQGLSEVPTVEKLRNDNLLNGFGWTDGVSETVMQQYGVKFTDSFEIELDTMLELLDQGNILYVMYRELSSEEGHSVMIKGYIKLGSSVNFIVSDPNYNMLGPFGYQEYTKDAPTMLEDMERHVPRYFIIPKGE
jgi:hypothetical protein